MKFKKEAPGTTLPPWTRQPRSKGLYFGRWLNGQLIVQSWPKKSNREPTPAEAENQTLFKRLVTALKDVMPIEQLGAREVAYGSKYIWRDVLARAMCGELIELGNYAEMVSQYNLDILGTEPGMIVIRAETWIALRKGEDGQVLLMVDGLPSWQDAGSGITELIGDIIAGPGSGAQTATLSTTGVVAGAYTNVDLTVDSKGRITDISDGTDLIGITQLTGDATAGPGSGSQVLTLSNSGVAPGTYTQATVTLDAKGRVTSASSGSVVGGITQLTGDGTSGPGSGSQILTLSTTGVSPGSYSPAAVTVDAKGRITAASTASLTPYINELTGDVTAGPGSGAQAATLAASGVTPGTYDNATVTFDAKGRATAAATGSGGFTIDRYHPGFISGRIYIPPTGGALTSVTLNANILYCHPIYIPQTITLATLRFQVNSTGTATLAEVGVWANNQGNPLGLILDCGSISVTTNGTKTFSSLSQLLTPGWHWLSVALNGTCTITCAPSAAGASSAALGVPILTSGSNNYGHVRGAWTFAAGALPSTFPSPAPDANIYPVIGLTF